MSSESKAVGVTKFGLIGAGGYVAPRHMRAIQAVGGRLDAAVDPHDAVGVIDNYFPDAHFFTEFERFDRHVAKVHRQGTPIDYISICSPNHLHDAHCRFALRSDADAICEKPVVLNPWNVDGLQEIEQSTRPAHFYHSAIAPASGGHGFANRKWQRRLAGESLRSSSSMSAHAAAGTTIHGRATRQSRAASPRISACIFSTCCRSFLDRSLSMSPIFAKQGVPPDCWYASGLKFAGTCRSTATIYRKACSRDRPAIARLPSMAARSNSPPALPICTFAAIEEILVGSRLYTRYRPPGSRDRVCISHCADKNCAPGIAFSGTPVRSIVTGRSAGRPRFPDVRIHESSYVDDPVTIGAGTVIWHFCHILGEVAIGRNCSIGQNVMIGPRVRRRGRVQDPEQRQHLRGRHPRRRRVLRAELRISRTSPIRARLSPARLNSSRRLSSAAPQSGRTPLSYAATSSALTRLSGAGAVVTRDVPNFA